MIIFTAIYNEMPWTPFFLNSLLEWDCPIIISEGAPQFPEPRSTDGSLEVIRDFADKHDHVQVIPTDWTRDRHDVEYAVWKNLVQPGEWELNLSPDNYYMEEDIPQLKKLLKKSNASWFLTHHRVFIYSFKKVVTRVYPGICGWWYRLWPCIIKKTKGIGRIRGDELPVDREGNYLIDPLQLQAGYIPPQGSEVEVHWEISMFHYKGVKKYDRLQVRFGDEKAQNWWHADKDDPTLFEEYNGPHPAILDDHPWRRVEDCRDVPID